MTDEIILAINSRNFALRNRNQCLFISLYLLLTLVNGFEKI